MERQFPSWFKFSRWRHEPVGRQKGPACSGKFAPYRPVTPGARGSTSVIMSEANSLIGALRKLNEKNLSNLIPHPLYSRFYNSHPTLVEREAALTDASCSLR
jgi:hypothetical protein